MDLSSIGLNVGILISIVGITEFLKQYKLKEKLKGFYFIIPLLLCTAAAFSITTPIQLQPVLKNILVYFGVSSLAYEAILKKVKS